MPPKPRGKKAKPQYRKKDTVADVIAERKIETAKKGKTTPKMLSETGGTRPALKVVNSGNPYGKFAGKSAPSSQAKEAAVLRSFDRNDQAEVLSQANYLLKNKRGWKGSMDADFVRIYGDTPKSRALYEAAQGQHKELRTVANTRRKIKAK